MRQTVDRLYEVVKKGQTHAQDGEIKSEMDVLLKT